MSAASRTPALVKAVLGPTNTGKTHLAIERMLAHASGMIGLPLRLLAREVYDRVVKAKGAGAAALITGEEKIAPETARYFIATVEAMPLDRPVEFVAVDEIQVARDPDRGHVFTDRILNARGLSETMLLGSDTMRPMIRRLIPRAELIARERLSSLSYAGPIKITKLPKRSAVVAFSAEEVYAIAELLRRHRGGAAVVMGALSPRTRNAQVALYQSGEVDFLVATDAIGMGLNMDVDHVAFASSRKFDGRRTRVLRPDEMAQIAGRAGRFQNDGAFGETGECAPFDEETVERIENHEFEAVEAIHWRNERLRFDSISALIAALEAPPELPGLMRVRGADDEETLKILAAEAEIAALTRAPAAVRRLWDVCQLPDFRKAALDEHARLVGRIALHLLKPQGRIPSDWIARETDKLDRVEGDLDVLQARLAQVRTWTYISHRADWLAEPEHWRARTRAIEDKLSDALHAALAQRFIDRRTSALLRGLKREDALLAGVSEEGEVTVEGHYVGRIEGLDFKPDPRALGLEGRAVRNAALRALRPEVSRRLARLGEAEFASLELGVDGRVRFEHAAVAKLAPGAPLLRPRLELIGAETAGEGERRAALQRLEHWLARIIALDLKQLAALDAAWREGRLHPAARGPAYQVVENAGALPRGPDLAPEALAALRPFGLRFGRHAVFFPGLIKPKPARLLAILAHYSAPAPHGNVFLPRPGALTAPLDPPRDWRECAAAGYLPAGALAVRFDQAERLAEAIRAARGPAGGREFSYDPAWARLLSRPAADLPGVLEALGYRRFAPADPETGAPERWRLPAERRAPERAPPAAGPFAALAELVPAAAPPPPRRKRRGGGRRP